MTAKPSVLVTGAAGYVGRLTVEALAARRDELGELVAMDVREPDASAPREGITWVAADIAEADLASLMRQHGIDTVVHLASIVRTPPGAPVDLAWRVDVVGTRRLLEACVEVGVEQIVVTTSGAAYGYHPDNPEWLNEDDPIRGNESFPYAHHKRLIEQMLADHRKTHPELGQLILRPGTVIGEGTESPVTDLFTGRVVLGIRGSESPFVFIWDRDLVACIVNGVLERHTGVFNLAGDGALSPREIASRLGKRHVAVPAGLVRTALRVLRALGRTEHGPEQVDFLRYRPVLSNQRLKEELGYTPKPSAEAFEIWARSRPRA